MNRPLRGDKALDTVITGKLASGFRIAAGEVTLGSPAGEEMETGIRMLLVLERKGDENMVLHLDVVEAAEFVTAASACVTQMLKGALGAPGLNLRDDVTGGDASNGGVFN